MVMVLIYSLMTGLGASVIRATAMLLFVLAGKLIDRDAHSVSLLSFVALLMLIYNPLWINDVGFQLSFAACIGIGVLSKRIGQVFDEIGLRVKTRVLKTELDEDRPLSVGEQAYRAVSAFLSVSFAAQIFTAPLLLYYFGYISGAGIFLNCLFVPLVSAVFGGLLCLVAIACILPIVCAEILLFLPNAVLSALLLLFDFFDFSKFVISGIEFSVYAFVPCFLACSFLSDKWNLKRKAKILLFFIGLGGMSLANILFSLAF
jgi:ComEC/Rec2-related protein